jgi:hypothetical protein
MLQSSGPKETAARARMIPEGAASLQEYAPHSHFEAGKPFSTGDNYREP